MSNKKESLINEIASLGTTSKQKVFTLEVVELYVGIKRAISRLNKAIDAPSDTFDRAYWQYIRQVCRERRKR